ncbi:MAG: hypothetical protein NC388_07610 [Clostridium sp.]|nr:hypothetical protein [Clostridium sp.]
MTCEEFKNAIIDEFGTGQDVRFSPECREHMKHCPECERYAREMLATAERMQISFPLRNKVRHSPVLRRLTSAAAVLFVFLCGVMTGLSNLFSTSTYAETTRNEFLSNAARQLSNVGNYVVDFDIRSSPYEGFGTLDATMPFMRMRLSVMHQDDSLFWRMEKESGRTALFDGNKQFLWMDNSLTVSSNKNVGFLDGWLHPDNLFNRQTVFIEHSDNKQTSMEETDSTVIITSEGIIRDLKGKDVRHRIENVFSRTTNLLLSMRVWKEHKGKMMLVLRSTECRYNVALTKEDILHVPRQVVARLEAEGPSVDKKRARALQKETATQAAERILNALIHHQPEQAAEALYFYRPNLDRIMNTFDGCTVSSFSQPRSLPNYPGVYVFFRLTHPDGNTRERHIALRRDNNQGIWMLDGGL